MRKQVVITTPFPTAEDLAETYGMSKTRLSRLMALAKEIRENGQKNLEIRLPLESDAKERRVREHDRISRLVALCARARSKSPRFSTSRTTTNTKVSIWP